MAYLWFSKSPDTTQNDGACYCDSCLNQPTDVHKSLAPYWYQGLRLRDGEKITIAKVKKCTQIMMRRLDEIDQPSKLQALTARVIHRNLIGSAKGLPLPKILREKIMDQDFDREKQEEMEAEFCTPLAKSLVGLLWQHLGYTIVQRCSHPFNTY